MRVRWVPEGTPGTHPNIRPSFGEGLRDSGADTTGARAGGRSGGEEAQSRVPSVGDRARAGMRHQYTHQLCVTVNLGRVTAAGVPARWASAERRTRPRTDEPLQVVLLVRLVGEPVAVVRVGHGDERPRALAERFA